MVSREDLKQQFLNTGATLTDKTLAKCEELCIAYSIDAEELADAWIAYSCSKRLDMEPTVEALTQMVRVEYGNKKPIKLASSNTPTGKLKVYNSSCTASSTEDDILSLYGATPKTKSGNSIFKKTPDQHVSPKVNFSPASFSPTVSTPSARYATRSNSGNVVCSYGDNQNALWHSSTTYSPTIKSLSSVPADSRYMFVRLREKRDSQELNMEYIADQIRKRAGIVDIDDITTIHPEPFYCYGRICYVSGNHLSKDNVCLESFNQLRDSFILSLDLKNVANYSLFPGQVVVVKATNLTRTQLIVHEIFYDGALPPSSDSFTFPDNEGALQVVIASGPYTQGDTLTYQPLEDLVDYLKKHRPHIVILTGPFVDAEHSQVKDGLLAETFDSFFEKQMESLIQSIEGLPTQVVLVASSRDIHHHTVYPTPAYVLNKAHSKLHLMGDPCIIDVDGVQIGVTSVDILKHIGNQESVNLTISTDRLGRLASHILMQRNFYPLYPCNESVYMDAILWREHCHLSRTPHIMVLPSDLRGFIKEAYGCILVNPEHLAKDQVGGSFARLEIKTGKYWNPTHLSGQIVKI